MGKVSSEQRYLHSRYVLCCLFPFQPLILPHSHSVSTCYLCMYPCAGQSLTSVKTKAGEALRLHRTSVGEEAQEEEEGAEQRGEGGGENENKDVSSPAEMTAGAAASGKGVFSTITHAVQNTVSEHKQKITLGHAITKCGEKHSLK